MIYFHVNNIAYFISRCYKEKTVTLRRRLFMHTFRNLTSTLLLCTVGFTSFAHEDYSYNRDDISQDPSAILCRNVVAAKYAMEAEQNLNPFAIIAYEPNYILPFNYSSSSSPYYRNNTPNNQAINKVDIKFQFSFKAPIYRDFFNYSNVLYLAYTQRSAWQAYNKSAFFRANNYKPEIMLENNVDLPLLADWNLQLFNVGAVHESNGRGGNLERSWNRIYMEAVFSRGGWSVAVRPWLVLHQNSIKKNNPNIERYLGHGRVVIAYKHGEQVVSMVTHNNIESGFRRGSVQLSYSFPLVQKIKGYVQAFTGYNQNLIEYNHRVNSVGAGICISDWL